MNTKFKKNYNFSKIIEDYKIHKSYKKVAKLNNISDITVSKILKQNKIPIVYKNILHIDLIPKALNDYNQGYSIKKIRDKYGISHNFFKKILKENGIEYVNRSLIPNNSKIENVYKNIDDIYSYYKEVKKLNIVSKKFEIPLDTLRRAFKQKKLFLKRNQNITEIYESNIKDKIYDFYINKKLNLTQISKEICITKYNVKKILIKYFGKNIIRPKEQVTREMNYSKEHQAKALENKFKNKEYKLPSGKIIKVMGYEDNFLDFVFQNNLIKEEEFLFDKKFRIKISNIAKNKHYYPDFYIPVLNLVIEIKSHYTYMQMKELNDLKFKKTKEAGYNFICIIDKNYKEFLEKLKELRKI